MTIRQSVSSVHRIDLTVCARERGKRGGDLLLLYLGPWERGKKKRKKKAAYKSVPLPNPHRGKKKGKEKRRKWRQTCIRKGGKK